MILVYDLEGANRQCDEDFDQVGMLKQIEVPTGGITEFTYEANEFLVGYENNYDDKIGAGLRLKKITIDPVDGQK
ncbi:MAG: hypothetical protein U5Q03_17915 [Bacteroidota bacterium]|nr:hypothetical protein [Bacteroidota bacterium]